MSVVLIGPPNSGKKTSLVLLHQTLIDYHEMPQNLPDGNRAETWTYTPITRGPVFDIYKEANNLMLNGRAPAPSPPSMIDQKIEFNIRFMGNFLRMPTQVNLILADSGGEITSTLIKLFPELIDSTPIQVLQKLLGAGLKPEEIDYLQRLLSAQGVILVADASTLGDYHQNQDAELAFFLNNVNKYTSTHGEKLKGVAVLLTKFDTLTLKIPGLENPTEEDLRQLVRNYLPITENFAADIQRNQGAKFKIFYSTIVPQQLGEDGMSKFMVETRNARNQTRVAYSVQQYLRLIHWLGDTFQGPVAADDDVLVN